MVFGGQGMLTLWEINQMEREMSSYLESPLNVDCHTVLASIDPRTHALEYKAQSPDEAALVQAAVDVSFEFCGHNRDILYLHTLFALGPVCFCLLNILKFTSARKRMSVLVWRLHDDPTSDTDVTGKKVQGNDEDVEDEVGPVLLLTKDADNVIYKRLAGGDNEMKHMTEAQLDGFAHDGLRMLMLTYREVPQVEYHSWVARYQVTPISICCPSV